MANDNKKSFKKRLSTVMDMFNVGTNPNADNISQQIYPTKTVKKDINSNSNSEDNFVIRKDEYPEHLRPYVEQYFNSLFSNQDYTKLTELYKDLDKMNSSDSYNARALHVIAKEVVQADTNMQPIFVEATRKQKKFILDALNEWGVYKLIEPTALSLAKYGNVGWALEIGDTGITSINPVDAYDITRRLEFNLHELEQQFKKQGSVFNNFYKQDRVKQYITSIETSNKTSSEFKDHLLGFQIGDKLLPPWRFLHFRNYSIEQPFKKMRMGKPLFVHAIAAYKKWNAAMTFQTVANMANLPIGKHTFSFPNIIDPAEKFKRLRSSVNNLQRVGLTRQNKEQKTLSDEIYTIEGAYDYSLISPDKTIGKLEDSEDLREERIVATLLPRFIIDPRESGFGEGGTTLVQKWKEFARLVFHIQSIILEQLTQLIKIHMVLSGEFALKDIDFTLSMPFPESKNEEVVNTQKDLIDLANNIFELLSDRLLGGEAIPDEIIFDVFEKLNIFDQTTVDIWRKQLDKAPKNNDPDDKDSDKDKDKEEEQEKLSEKINYQLNSLLYKKNRLVEKYCIQNKNTNSQVLYKLKETYGIKKLNEEIETIIFKQKQESFTEYKFDGKHVYSSRIKSSDFDTSLLREWVKADAKKLCENDQKKLNCDAKIKVNKNEKI